MSILLILSHDWLNYKQIHNLNYRLVFSDSAKKTQRWQSNFFLWIEDNEIVDLEKFNNICSNLS
ncbi:hypothetical protein FQP87_19900 [Vibrio tasmaniensis]|nr:hypothetical protein FQP87_19900 [Vibrio tasmaniensis]